jgi:hypothetical protein
MAVSSDELNVAEDVRCWLLWLAQYIKSALPEYDSTAWLFWLE